MSTGVFTCPKCGTDLTEAITAQLRESMKAEHEQQLQEARARWEKDRSAADIAVKQQLESQQRLMETMQKEFAESQMKQQRDFLEKIELVRKESENAALAAAQQKVRDRLQALEEENAAQRQQVSESEKREAEVLKRNRELADERARFELEKERLLAAEREQMQKTFKETVEEGYTLRMAEKEKLIDSLKKRIDDLNRTSQQGSQQAQGEVLELEIEAALRDAFRDDEIAPVPKGVRGADVIHTVQALGRNAGTILWETKRTKNWSKEWIPKLKEDMRQCGAHFGVIVSTVLPESVNGFDLVDGIWVCSPFLSIPLATVLRNGIIAIAEQRRANEDTGDKVQRLYNYLTGTAFKQHLNSIMESLMEMRSSLDTERNAFQKLWAKRERQILNTQASMLRIVGDFEGITGAALDSTAVLELPEGDVE